MHKNLLYFKFVLATILLCASIYFLFLVLPKKLITTKDSASITDEQGQIISARVAKDGQWRIHTKQAIPEKYKIALLTFEDKNFYRHLGISLQALLRATKQNINKRKIFSGGSTITMQVMRMSTQHKNRNLSHKLKEVMLAIRTEMAYSKDSILDLYIRLAPFGSNVVGIEAACMKYFGHSSRDLSWSEAATLAVLPNSPGMIYPGKNQTKLERKRNRLLEKLYLLKYLDADTYNSALKEDLPQKIYQFPDDGYHLLDACIKKNKLNKRNFSTAIQYDLQLKAQQLLQQHKLHYYANQIHNAAILIIDVKLNKVISYIGNISEPTNPNQNNVDIIQSKRSTGSLLKPYLYAHMLQAGELLPKQLVADIPTQISGFTPQNYALTYDGAVPAKNALARSLNIPAVRLLKAYGVQKFLDDLAHLGFTSFTRSADDYGLSLILGGGESTLYELSAVYASMAQKLQGLEYKHLPKLFNDEPQSIIPSPKINQGAIYQTFEAMLDVARPDMDIYWKRFGKSRKIAWKTGTSFGYRDAWAIGLTPDYVVGIWIGNATGEGRPNLTGIDMAAPLLFETFNLLPEKTNWFLKPNTTFESIEVCSISGHPLSIYCEERKLIDKIKGPLQVQPCPYHKPIQTDLNNSYRINMECATEAVKQINWFVLPPAMEHYYILNHADYKPLLPWKKECESTVSNNMELIYPEPQAKIYIPKELNNTNGQCIFELAHRNKNAIVFWYLDRVYLGKTNQKNQMAIYANKGFHQLTVTDQSGQTIHCNFEILNK